MRKFIRSLGPLDLQSFYFLGYLSYVDIDFQQLHIVEYRVWLSMLGTSKFCFLHLMKFLNSLGTISK